MKYKTLPCFSMVIVSLFTILAVLSACSSGPSSAAAPAAQSVIKLTSSCYLPPAHMLSGMMGEMMTKIQSQSNGRLEISYSAGGSILTAAKTADGLEQGLADIGVSHISYTPGRFPVTEALNLPLGFSSSWIGTYVALDYLEKYQPGEWDNFKVLMINGTSNTSVDMAKSPVRKLEDMKGKTLRGAGEIADAIKALGGTPRDIPMSDVYEAMSKGTIDGILISAETLKSFKLADVTKYTTYVPTIGNQYLFYVAMNKKKWDSLGPDLQKIFTDVFAEYLPKAAVGWNEINAQGFQAAIQQGAEFITLPEDEAARWKTAVQPVMENYITKMTQKGFKEQEVRDQLAFIRERIAYWEEQQITQKIPSEAVLK
jgi:TRAP-type transport system periplasmic protein